MRLLLAAIGRLKAEEKALVDRYVDRVRKSGRSLGFSIEAREIAESRAARAEARRREEASGLRAAAADLRFVALDQTGVEMDSAAFADRLRSWRDAGEPGIAFLIGGADGLDEPIRRDAALTLSLGLMTWPHQLARVLLAEQVYRAMTIIAGHPYHRG